MLVGVWLWCLGNEQTETSQSKKAGYGQNSKVWYELQRGKRAYTYYFQVWYTNELDLSEPQISSRLLFVTIFEPNDCCREDLHVSTRCSADVLQRLGDSDAPIMHEDACAEACAEDARP